MGWGGGTWAIDCSVLDDFTSGFMDPRPPIVQHYRIQLGQWSPRFDLLRSVVEESTSWAESAQRSTKAELISDGNLKIPGHDNNSSLRFWFM